MRVCPKCKEELVVDTNYGENKTIVTTLVCDNNNCDCDYSEVIEIITEEDALKQMYEEMEEDID